MSHSKANVLIWPTAFKNMEDVFNYIQTDNPDAAKELLEELHERIAALPDHPKLYRQGRVPNTKEMVVRKKYVVVYKETPNLISILRVLHAARQWP